MPKLERSEPYHHGHLREAMVNASLELIEARGVRALTLREIGARLGVSRTAPYRHFADKAALLGAIGAAGFQQFGDVLEEARQTEGNYFDQLNAMGAAYVQFAANHKAHFEVMFGAGGEALELDGEGRKVADRAFGLLEETIRDGQSAGEFVDGDPADIARMVWSLVHGISLLGFGVGGKGVVTAQFPEFCFAHLRTGLGKRSG